MNYDHIIKTVKHTGIYGMGNFVIKSIAVLLIPLYTHHLSPSDYGILQICNAFSSVLVIILNLGMTTSLFRVYYNWHHNEDRKILISTSVSFYILFSGLILFLLYMLSDSISNYVLGIKSLYLFRIILISSFFEGFLNLQLAVLRAKEKSITYSFALFIRALFYVLLNILFVAYLKRNYIGIREVTLISVLIAILILNQTTLKNYKPKIKLIFIKDMLKIGIPLSIGGLLIWILNLTDRYMLLYILDEEMALHHVGLYSLASRISSILRFVIVAPFMLAWGSIMFSYQNDINAKERYSSTLNFFVFACGIIFISISFFANNIIHLLSDNPEYYSAYNIVPILTYSIYLHGMYTVISVGVIISKKTVYVVYANLIAAVTNIILNYLFIPNYGMFGAAIASAVSYLLNLLVIYYFAQKVYHVNYEIVKCMLFSFILFSISMLGLNIAFVYKVLIYVILLSLFPTFNIISYKQLNQAYLYLTQKIGKK